MGRNKMLLEMDGKALVRRTVEFAIAAELSPVIVVLGHDAVGTRAAIDDLPCIFTTNSEFSGPTSGSLHRGLEAVPPNIEAAIILLGDMPFVTAAMVAALATTFHETPARLAASRYGDVLAPPLLFRRELFAELLAWNGEGCGKQVVMNHLGEAVLMDWPSEALTDIDTPDDARNFGLI